MNFGAELLEITKDNLSEAQFMAANLVNEEVKNRVFLNVAGAEAVMSHLERLGIDTSDISNIHSIKRVADKIDIADIMLENIHIDVRVIFDDNYIFVPKSHYKYGIVPDIYVVLKYDNSIERINLLGFFEPSDINFNNANNDYYFVEKDKLQSPFDMIDFISNFSGSSKKLLTQAEILRGRELSVMVADHDVNDDEFKEFLGLLLKSKVLRSSVLEYDNFETLASKAAFALRIKKTKESDDNIVDFDEFMSLDNFESAAEHNSKQSADNYETEDDNGDSMLDDNISEPIINRTLSIDNAAGAVAGSIIGRTIGAGLSGQVSASEKAIELAAMAGEEIADTAKNLLENDNPQAENQNHTGYSEKFKNKEDISDFVAEDNELAEPEIENTNEVEQIEDISDFVAEDTELAEPEIENTNDVEQLEDISDFVAEDTELTEPEIENTNEVEQIEDISDFVAEDNELAEPEIENTNEVEQLEDIPDFVAEDTELAEPEIENTNKVEQIEDISDFVTEDTELAEPEIENTNEVEQLEDISDFVAEDNELTEPEIENTNKVEQIEDISDFVTEDTELAEPEIENTNEVEQLEDISDFVAEDNELTEPEIENFDAITSESDLDLNINSDEIDESGVIQETEDNIADENIDIDNSLEELPTEESFADLNNSEFDFDISEPPTEESDTSYDEKFNAGTEIEANNFTADSFNFDADDELFEFTQEEYKTENINNDDESSETDNLYNENATSIPDNNTQTENNIEQTNTEEELISLNEIEKTVSDNNIDNTDDDNYLVDFDNSISDKKSDDSVQEVDDNEFSDDDLLVFPDKNESQEEKFSENISNENTFDFSDIDNIENNNITDNAEVSFEVIDDFDSFETIAPTEENFDINFSENDLVENNILDKNSVRENSVVISNKTFSVGEIFIDINKDSSRPETLTENKHLEELYNNSEIPDNTGLNNDVRIISNKSKQIPIFIGIGGLALLVIILGIIVFSVSKFINPASHGDPNALVENNSTNNLGTDVPNTADINNDNVVMNDNMQTPGRRGINNPSTPGIQQSQEQIATKPIPATAFLSVKKLSWEVPDYISYDPAFKQYLQSSGKGLKAALSSDLLLATDYTYSDQIRLSITYDRAGNFKNSKILLSSGSSQVDNIVLQSVNQTLRALKAPNSLGNDESTTLILKIYL